MKPIGIIFVLICMLIGILSTYAIVIQAKDGKMDDDSALHCSQAPNIIEIITPIRLIYCKVGEFLIVRRGE